MPKDVRYEIKYVGHFGSYHRLRGWLLENPIGFRNEYPCRNVNNVYFDNFDYTAFAENLSGVSERTKLRYRWYGTETAPGKGVLELKRKRNYYGWKLKWRLGEAPYKDRDTWSGIRRRMADQIDDDGKFWLRFNPTPVFINRYRREYFISSNGLLRATIDTEQSVCDQRYRSAPNFTRKAVLPDTFVVEFKFAPQDKEIANRTMQNIPLRVSRHSKYVNAVRRITEI